MRLVRILPWVLVAFLTACASQTEYKPAAERGEYGYTETQLSENRYRVTFTGNTITPKETVQDYALLRAAELALQNGYDWFTLASRETDKKTRATTSGGDFHHGPHTATSVYQRCGVMSCDTVVTQHPLPHHGGHIQTTTTRDSYSSSIEVVMGKDPMPKDVETYDARELASTLRRWMQTPKQR